MPRNYTPAHAAAQSKYLEKVFRVQIKLNPDKPNEARAIAAIQAISAQLGDAPNGTALKKLLLDLLKMRDTTP